jgi:hypothetical protein
VRISLLGAAPELAATVNRPQDWHESDPFAPVDPPGDAIQRPAGKKRAAQIAKIEDQRTSAQILEDARAAKARATQDWIAGYISGEEHDALHARADHIIQNKGRL